MQKSKQPFAYGARPVSVADKRLHVPKSFRPKDSRGVLGMSFRFGPTSSLPRRRSYGFVMRDEPLRTSAWEASRLRKF